MEIPTLTPPEEILEPTDWYEEEFDLLAFELWQRASRPEVEVDRTSEEVEPWCHASCL